MPILEHLEDITKLPEGGYELTPEAREAFTRIMAPYDFNLGSLKTHQELVDALRYVNAMEYERLVSKPAPTPDLQFIWRRLRHLGR